MNRVLPSLCLFLALCGPAVATDAPAPSVTPPTVPTIVELSPAVPVPKPPGIPLALSPDRYRWFGVTGYAGVVTWELDTEGVIGLREFLKPSPLFGRIEGAANPDFYQLPASSVVVWAKGEGQVRLSAFGVVDGKAKRFDSILLQVGPQPTPVPPGPVPPTPPVPPIPPTPPPSPAPIPDPGFRAAIIYETADLSKLPKEQLAILTSTAVRAYLSSKCVKGKDGKTPEWRVYDQNVTMGNESAIWQNAMKRPRQSLPWLILSDGTTGYEGPLPATVDATIALMQKYGK